MNDFHEHIDLVIQIIDKMVHDPYMPPPYKKQFRFIYCEAYAG